MPLYHKVQQHDLTVRFLRRYGLFDPVPQFRNRKRRLTLEFVETTRLVDRLLRPHRAKGLDDAHQIVERFERIGRCARRRVPGIGREEFLD